MSGANIFGDDEEEEEEDIIDVSSSSSDTELNGEGLVKSTPSAGIVTPADNLEQIEEGIEAFDRVKKRILSGEDIQKISGNNHITKSGWRKIATAFNLSVEVIGTKRIVEDGVVKYQVKARATAPNGKVVTGGGMCASNESNHMEFLSEDEPDESSQDDIMKIDGKWRRLLPPREVNDHNIMATAETRAKNRAISDLVGGGEVSAEEMKSFILE